MKRTIDDTIYILEKIIIIRLEENYCDTWSYLLRILQFIYFKRSFYSIIKMLILFNYQYNHPGLFNLHACGDACGYNYSDTQYFL